MVSLKNIEASNQRIKSTLRAGLVAIFVGATNGIGETTVRQFARHAIAPKVYIVGRSQEAGNRIVEECKALNQAGSFTFLKSDTSLMRNVDRLCEDIKNKERAINLLFLSVGTLEIGRKTEENLHYPSAVNIYARNHIISHLLPNLQQADDLKRVVSVFGGGFEGKVHMNDFQGENLSRFAGQGHDAALTTLAMEGHHNQASDVSFVHEFPGAVKSGIGRGNIGPLMRTMKTIFEFLGPLVEMPLVESGDRHLFLCTSARYPAKEGGNSTGVPLSDGMSPAPGTDGQTGSGVYSVDASGESSGPKIQKVLAKMRSEGLVDEVMTKLRADTEEALKKKIP